MSSQKVLFISQEITPYLPQTPMSEINRLLPQKVQEKGFEDVHAKVRLYKRTS